MSTELDVFSEDKFNAAVKVAATLAKSSIVPAHLRGKPEDVFATLVLGAELGFSPMAALNSIVLINGNATLKAQTMLAIARARVKDLSVSIKDDGDNVSVTIRRGEDSYTAIWNDEKAAAMGLLHKDNYKKQKATMLRWRALSEALKIMCSDVLMGLNTLEEMQDLEPIRNEAQPMAITTGKEDLENDFPIPVEDKTYGPLYKVQNGKFRDLRFHEIDMIELDEYREELRARSKKKTWEVSLLAAIDDYFSNYEIYREEIARMRDEQE